MGKRHHLASSFHFITSGTMRPTCQVDQPHSQTTDSILGEELFLPSTEISHTLGPGSREAALPAGAAAGPSGKRSQRGPPVCASEWPENQDKLVKFMIQIGVFSTLYLVPLMVVIGCYFYEQAYRGIWEATWIQECCREHHIPCPYHECPTPTEELKICRD